MGSAFVLEAATRAPEAARHCGAGGGGLHFSAQILALSVGGTEGYATQQIEGSVIAGGYGDCSILT